MGKTFLMLKTKTDAAKALWVETPASARSPIKSASDANFEWAVSQIQKSAIYTETVVLT